MCFGVEDKLESVGEDEGEEDIDGGEAEYPEAVEAGFRLPEQILILAQSEHL